METQLYKGLLTQIALSEQERDNLLADGWSASPPALTPDVNVPAVNPSPVEIAEKEKDSAPAKSQTAHATLIRSRIHDMAFAISERNRLAAETAQTGVIATPAVASQE